MGETVYIKTSCLKCGGSVEFPEEAENSTVPCPHCGKDLFLYRGVRAVGTPPANQPPIQKPPSNSPTQQQIIAAPTPANPNEALIGQVLIGIFAGIIVALGIGLAYLLASKMGWDGLGGFVSRRCFDLSSIGILGVLLVSLAVFAIFIFLDKKKYQTFKEALKANSPLFGFTVSLGICLMLTFPLFYSPPPEKYNVDYGVNWSLSHRVQWIDTKKNIFDTYRIVNQYSEKVGSEKHYIYDFEAKCPLVYVQLDENGRQTYRQGLGSPNSIMTPLNGSVTLVKKGEEWYSSETVRVH